MSMPAGARLGPYEILGALGAGGEARAAAALNDPHILAVFETAACRRV